MVCGVIGIGDGDSLQLHLLPQIQTVNRFLLQQGKEPVGCRCNGVPVTCRKQLLVFAQLTGSHHQQEVLSLPGELTGQTDHIVRRFPDLRLFGANAVIEGKMTVFQGDPFIHGGLPQDFRHQAVEIDVAALVLEQRLVFFRGQHAGVVFVQ